VQSKIYILMATYNGALYISEQIESIINQTYQNWTLIIHDDNSEDDTIDIIKKYQNEYTGKIILLDDDISCGGAKENFSYILNSIDDNFDYVMFCDQDDIWLENKIELTLDKMLDIEAKNKNKVVLIHTDLKIVDKDLNIISESMFNYQKLNLDNQYDVYKLAMENIITGCTMMLNKKLVYLSKNIPDEAIMHDWWIAIVTLKENGIIEFIDKGTILYRQHELNTIGSKEITFKYYIEKFKNMNSLIRQYNKIYKQLSVANIDISILNFLFTKTFMVFKKII